MRTHTRVRSITTVIAALFAIGLFASAVAVAGPLDKREVQARKDFAAGRYEQAAEAFADLFATTGDPIYLRNIGRCYQKLKRPAESISNFQDYLSKAKNLSSTEREEIEGFIKQMEAVQASQSSTPLPAPAPAPAAPVASPAAEPDKGTTPQPMPPPPLVVSVSAPNMPASAPGADDVQTGRSFRIAGVTTGVAGVALLATGLAFGLAAKSAGEENSNSWDPDRDRAGKNYETLQWVGYGLGAAALGTGVFLYVYGRTFAERTQTAARWRIRTALGRDGGGLAVEGRF
jgi:hypothetical protein